MQSRTKKKQVDITQYMVYIIFVFAIAIFALWLGGMFFSVTNLLNIIRQTAAISVMAVGMTFVLATGGIDLTISGIVPTAGLVSAMILNATNNIFLGVAVPLAMGAVVGLANGLLITFFTIPPFILLNHTAFGRKVLAVGGNAAAAEYTGVKVNKVLIQTYILSGILSATAGLLYCGRTKAAKYTYGEGVEMDVIAAVVLGGTAMSGGTGNILGSIVGALLMGMINNGLIMGGLSVSQQKIVRGIIIIIAVAIGNLQSRKKKV